MLISICGKGVTFLYIEFSALLFVWYKLGYSKRGASFPSKWKKNGLSRGECLFLCGRGWETCMWAFAASVSCTALWAPYNRGRIQLIPTLVNTSVCHWQDWSHCGTAWFLCMALGVPPSLHWCGLMGMGQVRSAEQSLQFLLEETGNSWPIWSFWNALMITRVVSDGEIMQTKCHNQILVGL